MNEYVALTIRFRDVPLVTNSRAAGDKGSFTAHLTNAEELPISLI